MAYRLAGSLEGRPVAFNLRPGLNRVGSGADCDLRLTHPTVSRRHAELTVTDDGVELVDLESSNGTFLDARRLGRGMVQPGQQVAFGRVSLRLETVGEEDVQAALELPERGRAAARAEKGTAASTIGVRALDAFALEHVPSLVRTLLEGAGPALLAQRGGSALFETLPCLAVEVATQEEGLLFQAARTEAPGDGVEAVAGDDELRVRVVFAQEGSARLFVPLVQTVADLLRLAAGMEPAAGGAEPAFPPLPEPPSVDPEVQRIYAEAGRVARGDVGVLIGGESGTGKEVLARYIHAASRRARQPFVALNCAALPRDLLEAELFGIERGVATGVEARAGKFELAHGGTLFLDEIGDMALETQAKLLRVLQERVVHRLGAVAPRNADVRVLAATNRDVRDLIGRRLFREDLYYRIATWTVELPPLRRRRADIPNLALHFLARAASRAGVRVKGISRGALQALTACDWPGNVRQLENEMARAVLFLSDGELLDSARLSPDLRVPPEEPDPARLAGALERTERDQIVEALQACEGDVTAAAARLGLGRSTLYRRMKALGIG